MNLTALLKFESSKYIGAQTQNIEMNTFVASSLRYVIEHFFMQVAPSFMIVISCRRSSPLNFYKSIMELLYNSMDNMIIQLVQFDYSNPQRIIGNRIYNLLLVDSYEAFLDLDVISYTKKYDRNEYYYIFLQQRDILIFQDMQAIFEYCWKNQIINCNIQTQNAKGDLHMFTYFPYTPSHCEKVIPQQINQFVGTSWIHKTLYPKKLENFFKCPLNIAVRNRLPFFTAKLETNGIRNRQKYVLRGPEGRLLELLRKKLNFSLNLTFSDMDLEFENKCCSILDMVIMREVHMGIGCLKQRARYGKNLTTTLSHYQNTIVATVYLNAHNLTTFQILTFPFQTHSWLFILVIIIGTCVIANFIVQWQWRTKVKYKSSLFTNIISTTFGVSSVRTPKRLHNRLLYIAYVWATFLLRSIYSALLYHLYRSHVHQKLPKTLLQLLYQKYIAVMHRVNAKDISEIPYFQEFSFMTTIIHNITRESDTMQYLEKFIGGNKVAFISRDVLFFYVNVHKRSGMFHIVPEDVVNQQLTLYLPKHSFLIEQLNDVLVYVQEIGFMSYWSRHSSSIKYFKSNHLNDNRVIDQSDLWGLYFVIGFVYICALLLFILELLSNRCVKLRQILITIGLYK